MSPASKSDVSSGSQLSGCLPVSRIKLVGRGIQLSGVNWSASSMERPCSFAGLTGDLTVPQFSLMVRIISLSHCSKRSSDNSCGEYLSCRLWLPSFFSLSRSLSFLSGLFESVACASLWVSFSPRLRRHSCSFCGSRLSSFFCSDSFFCSSFCCSLFRLTGQSCLNLMKSSVV